MRWYKKIYLGDMAQKAKYKVFGRIRKNRFQFDTFLITLPDNSSNLLEICLADQFLQPYYKNEKVQDNIYVVGIAKGYKEAQEVVRRIIDDVYKNTGTFDIRSYLHFGTHAE